MRYGRVRKPFSKRYAVVRGSSLKQPQLKPRAGNQVILSIRSTNPTPAGKMKRCEELEPRLLSTILLIYVSYFYPDVENKFPFILVCRLFLFFLGKSHTGRWMSVSVNNRIIRACCSHFARDNSEMLKLASRMHALFFSVEKFRW